MNPYIIPFEKLKSKDLEIVGGKNASIGEMISTLSSLGVSVPGGFATTSHAYRDFLAQEDLTGASREALGPLDVDDVERLADRRQADPRLDALDSVSGAPAATRSLAAWRKMGSGAEFAVAVRSSATAEDLPEASFAGQQETFLNVRGEAASAHLRCTRSTPRCSTTAPSPTACTTISITTRWRSPSACSTWCAAISVRPASCSRSTPTPGFRDVVFITSSYGLGETVVQGAVNPDEFYVYKPALRAGRRSILRKNLGQKAIKMVYGEPGTQERVRTVDVPAEDRQRFSIDEADVVELAQQALVIEEHYGTPMDIEWGKDGETGKIYILQARPETVQSRAGRTIQRFTLEIALDASW